jgi:hypothetical protein
MPLTLADGRKRVTVLTTKPANLTAITVAELAAGIYASPRINKPDYRLSPAASDTVADQPLEQEGNATTFGNSNYEGTVTVLRFLDNNGKPVLAEDILWDAMKTKGTRLWFVEREGPKATAADATGDLYEVFEVITDTPQKPSDMAGYIKRVVPLGVQDHRTGTVV